MESLDLKEYLEPLRKWWWMLLAAALTAAISALLYLMMQPPQYQSTTTLMIGNFMTVDFNPNQPEVYLAQQLATSYANMAQRSGVKEAAKQSLGLENLPGYSAAPVPNTTLLELSVIDSDPQRAQLVAAELANQLIRLSPSGTQNGAQSQFIAEQLASIEQAIRVTEDELVADETELTKLFSARDIQAKREDINQLTQKLTQLRNTYASLLRESADQAVNTLSVFEPASLPGSPIDRQLPLNVIIASMVGLVLAAGAAYLMEYLDNTLRTAEQVKREFGLATLGAIPMIQATGDSDHKLVMLESRQNSASEAFRILRTNLQFAGIDRPLQLVLITSPQPAEGKSLTSANLSVALARSGKRVILVDTDLHRPSQHRIFRLINHAGLTNALLGDYGKIDSLLQPTIIPGLRLLTTGPLPPNPAELLSSKRMQNVLNELRELADIVILDSPPVTVVADTAQVASEVDGVIVVLNVTRTTREMARKALAALGQVKARVLGVLLNGVSESDTGYHYSYSSGYNRGYHRNYRKEAGNAPKLLAVRDQPMVMPNPAAGTGLLRVAPQVSSVNGRSAELVGGDPANPRLPTSSR